MLNELEMSDLDLIFSVTFLHPAASVITVHQGVDEFLVLAKISASPLKQGLVHEIKYCFTVAIKFIFLLLVHFILDKIA